MPVVGSFPMGLILHGPCRHILQHRPREPNLHCAPCAADLSMMVVTPSPWRSENMLWQLWSQHSHTHLSPALAPSPGLAVFSSVASPTGASLHVLSAAPEGSRAGT